MFYIVDIKDMSKVGVLDSTDNSIEYYSKSQIKEFVKNGMRIAGVANDFSLFEVKESEFIEYYTGDYQGVSRYDALITTVSDGVTVAGEIPYRIGMLYNNVLTVEGHYSRFYQAPTSILIGSYDTKSITYQETLGNYIVDDENLKHKRYLPAVKDSTNVLNRAFLMMCNPLRVHYGYGYELSKFVLVDAVQTDILQKYTTGASVFIIRLAYSADKRVRVVLNTHDSVLLETFYTDFVKKRITVFNAVLTDVGFTYWGLDGTYSVNIETVRRNGKFILEESIRGESRGKLLKTSSYVVQENGVLIRSTVFGDKLEIPSNCTFVDYKCITKGDNISISKIIIPESVTSTSRCRNIMYEWFDNRGKYYFAPEITVTFRSNSTAAVFDLFVILGGVRSRYKQRIKLDWDNSNRAVLLIGYFTYRRITEGEINKMSVQDMVTCARFYLDFVTPKVLDKCVELDICDIWINSEDGQEYIKSFYTARQKCKRDSDAWRAKFTKAVIEKLESGEDGIRFLLKYLRHPEHDFSEVDIDLFGWLTCYEVLIEMKNGGLDFKFCTEELESVLAEFNKIGEVLLNAHIYCLQEVVRKKTYRSFYRFLTKRYF